MITFDINDFTDQLPNFGYIEVRLQPAKSDPRLDIAKAAKTMLEVYLGFKDTAMKQMIPQFFDIMITDEDRIVNTKISFNINPQNSTAVSTYMLRIQVDRNTLPMVDSFRNLPDDTLMSMFSHALGLLIPLQE